MPRESDNVVKWVSARSNAATMRYVTWGSQRGKKRRRWSERLVAWSGKRQEARGSRHETNEYQKGLASQGKTCRRRQHEAEGRKEEEVWRKRGSDSATSNDPRMRPHPLPRGLSGDQESERSAFAVRIPIIVHFFEFSRICHRLRFTNLPCISRLRMCSNHYCGTTVPISGH